MTRRAVDLARKAARLGEPEDGLAAVAALRAHLDALEARHVEDAFARGASWSRIAELLGVSRQAAHKKYAARLRERKEGRLTEVRPATTERVRQTVTFARQEAGAMGHRSVGPEHLLLGLLRDDRGPAVKALDALGVSFAGARREVRRLYGDADEAEERPPSNAAEIPVSTRARASLEDALREAARARGERLGTEHLLAALLRDTSGGAARALAALGVTAEEVERELESQSERVGKGRGLERREGADHGRREGARGADR
jgi:hypothetical protein